MPYFTNTFTQGAPMINVMIGVSAARTEALKASSQPVPAVQNVRGLIDTGASHTCVDPSVFAALGLTATGTVPVITPSTGNTPAAADTFDVSLMIMTNLNSLPLFKPNMQVTSSELLQAQGFAVLIGRDILSHCLLTYNGASNLFSLAY